MPEKQITTPDMRRQRRAINTATTPHTGLPMPNRPGPSESSEPSTVDVGSLAEQAAVDFLVDRGYSLVERNYHCKVGELDIVAARDDTMVFVEVRSRADDEHGNAIESVHRRKQRKVTRVAEV